MQFLIALPILLLLTSVLATSSDDSSGPDFEGAMSPGRRRILRSRNSPKSPPGSPPTEMDIESRFPHKVEIPPTFPPRDNDDDGKEDSPRRKRLADLYERNRVSRSTALEREVKQQVPFGRTKDKFRQVYQVPEKLFDVKHIPYHAYHDYVAVTLNYKLMESLRNQIRALIPGELSTRDEAHLTIFSPPQMDILLKFASWEKIHSLTRATRIQQADFRPICVGLTEGSKVGRLNNRAFYIIVGSTELEIIRQDIIDKIGFYLMTREDREALGKWYPHITIGFQNEFNDIYVPKTTLNCVGHMSVV